jgi:hypothetical protein
MRIAPWLLMVAGMADAATPATDWPAYGGDTANTGYLPPETGWPCNAPPPRLHRNSLKGILNQELAGVAELADARDSKSRALHWA